MASNPLDSVSSPITEEVTYVFTAPKTGYTFKTLSMRELTPDDEIMAAERSRGQGARLAWELAKGAVAAVDGRKCNTADGSVDIEWVKLGPKGRNLVLTAYHKIHNAEDGDVADFLGSQKVAV